MKWSDLFLRFRKNPNGETVRVEDDLEGLGNGYLRKIGQYFKTAQILLFVLLFLFVTLFALICSESITYQNLYYLAKDFRTAVDNTDVSVEGIAYEVDPSPSFAVFKGGLAVAGRERLQLLTAAGGMNTSDALGMANPGLSASTSLLLVYARGENFCRIYNSFTMIHSDETDYDIRTAYLSESGAYSLVTEDFEYESAVYVYGRTFEKLNKYNLNSYVIASPISDDGKTIAILSYAANNGVFDTRLRMAKVGSDQIYCDYWVAGDFPLGVSFTDNGTAIILTDNGLYRVSAKKGGERLADFAEESVRYFAFDGENTAVLFASEDRGTVKVFSSNGEILYSGETTAAVRAFALCGSFVFFRTDTEIVRIAYKTGKSDILPCTVYGGTFLAASETRVLICFTGETKYYSFTPLS